MLGVAGIPGRSWCRFRRGSATMEGPNLGSTSGRCQAHSHVSVSAITASCTAQAVRPLTTGDLFPTSLAVEPDRWQLAPAIGRLARSAWRAEANRSARPSTTSFLRCWCRWLSERASLRTGPGADGAPHECGVGLEWGGRARPRRPHGRAVRAWIRTSADTDGRHGGELENAEGNLHGFDRHPLCGSATRSASPPNGRRFALMPYVDVNSCSQPMRAPASHAGMAPAVAPSASPSARPPPAPIRIASRSGTRASRPARAPAPVEPDIGDVVDGAGLQGDGLAGPRRGNLERRPEPGACRARLRARRVDRAGDVH